MEKENMISCVQSHMDSHTRARTHLYVYAVLLHHQAPCTLAVVCPLRGSGLFEEVVCDLSSAQELLGCKETHMC